MHAEDSESDATAQCQREYFAPAHAAGDRRHSRERTKENERERTKKKVIHKTNQVTVNTEDSERDRATQVWEKCILLLSVICRR